MLAAAAVAALAAMLWVGPMAGPGRAATVVNTGNPDGKMAMASRPATAGNLETEAADDFILTSATALTNATFVGLLPTGAPLSSITQVRVEIYRVFPKDSNTSRTPDVPTRVNSPSDVEFVDRDTANHTLSFTTTVLSPSFTAANSVDTGIHPKPNQTTGGEGPRTGQEVRFNVTFTPGISLPADHYFFIPQVALSFGHFFWLSAPKPIVAPGTPFSGDLQTWIRNSDLDPDWLRVGTDIVGAGAFNATFSLTGTTAGGGGSGSGSGSGSGGGAGAGSGGGAGGGAAGGAGG